MKLKKFLIFPLLISLFGTSCSSKNKIIVQQKENIDSFVYLEKDELNFLLNSKQDFVLVVGEKGCYTCEIIKPILADYIKKYEYVIYWVENRIYKDVASNNDDLKDNIYSASILLFDNGLTRELIEYNDNLYYSKNQLETTLERKISGSNIYLINDFDKYEYSTSFNMYKINLTTTNLLDEKVSSNNDNFVLYSWGLCPDCMSLKTDVLDSLLTNKNKKLYTFETSYVRSDKDNFALFTNKYKFDDYRGGKVPTIVKYNNGSKVNMHVYLNDEFVKNDDGSYYIKTSFISELVNTTYPDSAKMFSSIKEIHKAKVIEYLENNL